MPQAARCTKAPVVPFCVCKELKVFLQKPGRRSDFGRFALGVAGAPGRLRVIIKKKDKKAQGVGFKLKVAS